MILLLKSTIMPKLGLFAYSRGRFPALDNAPIWPYNMNECS
jgi:hypothetical protein